MISISDTMKITHPFSASNYMILQLENKPKAVNSVELYNNKHAYLQYH